jgi:hypothetical protein
MGAHRHRRHWFALCRRSMTLRAGCSLSIRLALSHSLILDLYNPRCLMLAPITLIACWLGPLSGPLPLSIRQASPGAHGPSYPVTMERNSKGHRAKLSLTISIQRIPNENRTLSPRAKSSAPRKIHTGRVSTQARRMLRSVSF